MNRPGTVAIPPSSFQHSRRLPRCLPCCPVFSKSAIADNRCDHGHRLQLAYPKQMLDIGLGRGHGQAGGQAGGAAAEASARARGRQHACFFVLSVTRTTVFGRTCFKGRPPRQIYLCVPSRHHSPASHKAVLDVFGSALSYSGSGAVSPTPDIHPLCYMLF